MFSYASQLCYADRMTKRMMTVTMMTTMMLVTMMMMVMMMIHKLRLLFRRQQTKSKSKSKVKSDDADDDDTQASTLFPTSTDEVEGERLSMNDCQMYGGGR